MSDHGVTGTPPARLTVGLVSAGRVGTAIGAALERRGHVVSALVARSSQSRDLAARRLPEARITDPADAAAAGELLILAVPDSALPGVVAELADVNAFRATSSSTWPAQWARKSCAPPPTPVPWSSPRTRP